VSQPFQVPRRCTRISNTFLATPGPFEVESTLRKHPAVAECAVISSPDETRGEVVKAIVVLAPGYPFSSTSNDALIKELQDFCKASSAPYKYPRKISFMEAETLPRTTSGKIKRAELRKVEWRDAKARARTAHKL
jgi:acyl-coenzyme A synthetase/AMP-(fatty) acid ligase